MWYVLGRNSVDASSDALNIGQSNTRKVVMCTLSKKKIFHDDNQYCQVAQQTHDENTLVADIECTWISEIYVVEMV